MATRIEDGAEMERSPAERMLELEEAAEGTELFRPPGADLQVEKARDQAEASGWIPDASEPGGSGALRSARLRRDALRAAMQDLEATVARPAPAGGWSDAVVTSLTGLRTALEAHIREAESPAGLLEEITTAAPRLAGEVEAVREEHMGLAHALDRVEAALENRAGVPTVRRRVMSLLGWLAIHRQHGSDLVYEAYTVDLGAGD